MFINDKTLELSFSMEEMINLNRGEVLKIPEINKAYLKCTECKRIVLTTDCFGSSHVCMRCKTNKQKVLSADAMSEIIRELTKENKGLKEVIRNLKVQMFDLNEEIKDLKEELCEERRHF